MFSRRIYRWLLVAVLMAVLGDLEPYLTYEVARALQILRMLLQRMQRPRASPLRSRLPTSRLQPNQGAV